MVYKSCSPDCSSNNPNKPSSLHTSNSRCLSLGLTWLLFWPQLDDSSQPHSLTTTTSSSSSSSKGRMELESMVSMGELPGWLPCLDRHSRELPVSRASNHPSSRARPARDRLETSWKHWLNGSSRSHGGCCRLFPRASLLIFRLFRGVF
jgi:hypothetical protein